MNEKIELLCGQIFGAKRFEIFKFLCERADENGFVFVTIDEMMKELDISKPTAINALNFWSKKGFSNGLKTAFTS